MPSPKEDGFLPGTMDEDRIYVATRRAVQALGAVSRMVAEERPADDFHDEFDDPGLRDSLLTAVRKLSPTSSSGLRTLEIGGRRVGQQVALTSDTRKHARGLLGRPPRQVRPPATFIGVVREIDLDSRRFELRRIVDAEFESVRCAYEERFDSEARSWLDRDARIFGRIEVDSNGRPRLLWVDHVQPTPDAARSEHT